MTHESSRVLNGRAADEAASIASWLVEWMLPRAGGSVELARFQLQAQYGLPAHYVKSLTQPSRRPKRVDADLWLKLRAAKLRVLEHTRASLEREVAKERRLGALPAADLDRIAGELRRIADWMEQAKGNP